MFWDDLMRETGVAPSGWTTPTNVAYDYTLPVAVEWYSEYNVGDVIVGEIVEETAELTSGSG